MAAAEHEAGGEGEAHGGARDGHRAVFQRLAQDFEDVAGELRQLVQEEQAVVGERDLAGARDHAAADESGVGDGVVRRAEGTVRDQAAVGVEYAGDGVDLGGLQRLLEAQGSEDGRKALGQHGLAGAGRADHQDVVSAGGGDLQRALGHLLAAHVLEVVGKVLQLVEQAGGLDAQRLGFDAPERRRS